MNYNNYNGYLTPSCEILVNGQKRKLYGKNKNKIYLNDGDEFQLKVYNPLSERIGFQLKMNGTDNDNTVLVINPGQSAIIERFIGTNRKLKFSTYVVDKNNPQTKSAIKDNGKLEVVFWNEFHFTTGTVTTWVTQPYIQPIVYPTPSTWPTILCGSSSGTGFINDTPTYLSDNIITNTVNYKSATSNIKSTNTCDLNGNLNVRGSITVNGVNMTPKLAETGRIEEGKKSNQHFSQTNFTCGTVIQTYCFKLLPFSEKPKEVVTPPQPVQGNPYIIQNTSYVKSEGRDYCPNKRCNYRVRRGNWAFCPMCGHGLD